MVCVVNLPRWAQHWFGVIQGLFVYLFVFWWLVLDSLRKNSCSSGHNLPTTTLMYVINQFCGSGWTKRGHRAKTWSSETRDRRGGGVHQDPDDGPPLPEEQDCRHHGGCFRYRHSDANISCFGFSVRRKLKAWWELISFGFAVAFSLSLTHAGEAGPGNPINAPLQGPWGAQHHRRSLWAYGGVC